MKSKPTANRRAELLRMLPADEERALWAARLEGETPEGRVQTAREHLLNIRYYGYDASTGHSVRPRVQTLN